MPLDSITLNFVCAVLILDFWLSDFPLKYTYIYAWVFLNYIIWKPKNEDHLFILTYKMNVLFVLGVPWAGH